MNKFKIVKTLMPVISCGITSIGVLPMVSCAVEQDHSKDRIVFPEYGNETYLSIALANKTDKKHIQFKCLAENITQLTYSVSTNTYIGTPYSSKINQIGNDWFWDFQLLNTESMLEKEGAGYTTIHAEWKNSQNKKVEADATINWFFTFA